MNKQEKTLYIVGDSTSCIYEQDSDYAIPRGGWGMYIAKYLNDKVVVNNLALSGRSSKSYVSEDNYKKYKDSVDENDIVIVQFGHNDEKCEKPEDIENRYTEPLGSKEQEGSFKYYLYNYYVKVALEKGASVILVSPVSRRHFDEYKEIIDSHGSYRFAVRDLAREVNVPFLDLTELSRNYFNNLGVEKSIVLQAAFLSTEKGDGGIDNTHFSHYGADCIARLIAEELKDERYGFSEYVLKYGFDDEYVSMGDFRYALERVMGNNEALQNSDRGFIMTSSVCNLIADKMSDIDLSFDISALGFVNDGHMVTAERSAEAITRLYCYLNGVKDGFTLEG